MNEEYTFETAFGAVEIQTNDNQLSGLQFCDHEIDLTIPSSFQKRCIHQITEYLNGQRTEFDLDVAIHCTPFQQRVYQEVMAIPFGKTITYAELAEKCGGSKHTRAVARANATNTLLILIPCHRVIGSDGSLTGYAGGLAKKKRLLQMEGALPQLDLFA